MTNINNPSLTAVTIDLTGSPTTSGTTCQVYNSTPSWSSFDSKNEAVNIIKSALNLCDGKEFIALAPPGSLQPILDVYVKDLDDNKLSKLQKLLYVIRDNVIIYNEYIIHAWDDEKILMERLAGKEVYAHEVIRDE